MPQISSFNTPLRYPGGKSRITNFLEDLFLLNNLEGSYLYELYAGGAGASVNILFSGLCKKIVLNDLDYHIYSFWKSILDETDNFIKLIRDTNVNIDNWEKQKYIYDNYEHHSALDVGFSTFFLNRTNRSGILYKAGPIGGMNQKGNFLIDARFNKNDLIRRIEKIALMRNKIEIHNKETMHFLKYIFKLKRNSFIFLDPPYYQQGENLYLNFYKDKEHKNLSELLQRNQNKNWLLTYDNSERIRELYKESKKAYFPMSHSLQAKKKAKEIMVISKNIHLPKSVRIGKKSNALEMI